MKLANRFATIAGLAVATSAAFVAPATAATHTPPHQHAGPAVFVQSDNPSGNTITAYDRGDDGSLTAAGSFATGGLGGVLAGSVVDHTASQGSLSYDRRHHLLYAVNAGSNTVSVFRVHGDRLVLQQVIGSGGSFPVSIAVHGNLVYVVNARDGGSIQGFLLVDRHLVKVSAWHRDLGLDTTATPEFTHTPGQVVFTPDGSHLIVTTKANGNTIDVFPIGRLGAPGAVVVNAEPAAVPFAVSFDAAGLLAVTEAGPNAVVTFSLDRAGKLTQLGSALTGQAATCWVVRSGGHLYASNAGSGSITDLTVSSAGQLTAVGNTATDGGTVDAAASSDGRYLYVQTGAAGIVDEYRIAGDGSLTSIGSVTVPGAVGGEGIVAL